MELNNKSYHCNNFTMIHIVAAVMVIVGHQFALMGVGQDVQIMGITIHIVGVRILFLVSGYLVCGSFLRSSNVGKYIIKRITRIYPPLILCLVITTLFMRLVTNNPEWYWQSALNYFLYNIEMRPKFDLAGVFETSPYPYAVNGSLWTLPIELVMYLILIIFVKIINLIDRYNKYFKFIFSFVVLALLSWGDAWYVNLQGKSLIIWYTDWARAIVLAIYFFVGVIFQILDLKRICNWQVGLLMVVLYSCLSSTIIKNIVAPYLISYVVMCFALVEKPLFCNLFKKDICYGMYLYAFPVQQMVIWFFIVKMNINLSVYVLLLLSLLITVMFAEIQYWLIEEKGILKVAGKIIAESNSDDVIKIK